MGQLFGKVNKPGLAQVGAISKAQKQQKDFKVSKYSLLQHRTKVLEKSHNAGKKLKGDPLVSPSNVCYAKKR